MPIPSGNRTLLTVDSIVNLALGVLLMAFPEKLVEQLGLPAATNAFYPNILGAVLFGIGIALWLARNGNAAGLGLVGAVSINLCGGIVLALWLMFGDLLIPAHGQLLLWFLAGFLIIFSGVELIAHYRMRDTHSAE